MWDYISWQDKEQFCQESLKNNKDLLRPSLSTLHATLHKIFLFESYLHLAFVITNFPLFIIHQHHYEQNVSKQGSALSS